ncbi:MAG: CoA-binding protein [Cyanophyceae cyanobacterium]
MWTVNQVLVQGIDNSLGSGYAAQMKAYGTNIVAEVIAGQGGQTLNDIPIFNLVEEAVAEVGAIDTTLIFVEAYAVLDAALEAIASDIKQMIIVTRGVPPLDMVKLLAQAETDTVIVGPGSGGIVVPEKMWLGIDSPRFYCSGSVGIIGRTHALSNEVALELNRADLGQSLVVSIGNDGIVGSSFQDWLRYLDEDDATEVIVLIGYAGGILEEATAQYLTDAVSKPVIVYLCGLQAPAEKPVFAQASVKTGLSYSVPSVSQPKQTLAAFKKAKVTVAQRPAEIPALVKKALEKSKKNSGGS